MHEGVTGKLNAEINIISAWLGHDGKLLSAIRIILIYLSAGKNTRQAQAQRH